VQRALLQFFKPENWGAVRDALVRAGREDLIGEGPDCLIPSRPPRIPRPDSERGDARPPVGSPARGAAGYRRPSRERGRR
jgi:hypothetical protein